MRFNRAHGVDAPFFVSGSKKPKFAPIGRRNFSAIDPHLGFAYSPAQERVRNLETKYTWHRGFAIYSKRPISDLEKPIILTLGGSTTDPIQYGHSWPEKLARLLIEKGLKGTIINGGTGGYSTSQELIKLIRDGLEFAPDIVISYSGVNDRGRYSKSPNHMVHSYQRYLLERLTAPPVPPLMPNAILFVQRLTRSDPSQVVGYTFGVDTKRSYGQTYERNLNLMRTIATASGAKFIGVVQPNAYIGDYDWANEFIAKKDKSKAYIASLKSLYREIDKLLARYSDVYDFTRIFSGIKEIYVPDGIHTTDKGEVIIAKEMLKLIEPRL